MLSVIISSAYYNLQSHDTSRALYGDTNANVSTQGFDTGNLNELWHLIQSKYGDGFYHLKVHGTNLVLDNKSGTAISLSNLDQNSDSQIWEISTSPYGSGYYQFKNRMTNNVLDGNANGDVYTLPQDVWNGFQTWRLLLNTSCITWIYKLKEIKYQEASIPPSQKDLISSTTIDNSSGKSTIQQTVVLSTSKTSSFEWGLTEGLRYSEKISVKLDIPFGGAVSSEVSWEASLQSHQKWGSSTTVNYSVSETVTVPPGDAIRIEGYVDWADDIETPFTMWILVAAKIGDDCISGTDLMTLFNELNPEAKVEKIIDDQLVVSLKGNFIGSYGINKYTKMSPLSIENS